MSHRVRGFLGSRRLLAPGVGGLLLALASSAPAQISVAAQGEPVRVEWTTESPKHDRQPVCGYVYNDALVATREVQLLVESRDPADRVITSRQVPVLGYISPRSRSYFCSIVKPGAARYQVSVVSVQWGNDR
jgi:hypothetical protein